MLSRIPSSVRSVASARPWLLCAGIALQASGLLAQSAGDMPAMMARAASHDAVRQAFAALERDNAWTLDQQVSLCEIPAPPFKETARGLAFRDRLVALGVHQVRIDREGNVSSVNTGGSDIPDAVFTHCVATVFQGTRFPSPEGGIVTVAYPIVFTPGK